MEPDGERWTYVDDPHRQTIETRGQLDMRPTGTKHSQSRCAGTEKTLGTSDLSAQSKVEK